MMKIVSSKSSADTAGKIIHFNLQLTQVYESL